MSGQENFTSKGVVQQQKSDILSQNGNDGVEKVEMGNVKSKTAAGNQPRAAVGYFAIQKAG